MNKTVLFLIERDMMNLKLIDAFKSIGWDADIQLGDFSTLIFKLIGIKKANRTDELYHKYYSLLKPGIKIDINAKEAQRELAMKIYTKLLKHR